MEGAVSLPYFNSPPLLVKCWNLNRTMSAAVTQQVKLLSSMTETHAACSSGCDASPHSTVRKSVLLFQTRINLLSWRRCSCGCSWASMLWGTRQNQRQFDRQSESRTNLQLQEHHRHREKNVLVICSTALVLLMVLVLLAERFHEDLATLLDKQHAGTENPQ